MSLLSQGSPVPAVLVRAETGAGEAVFSPGTDRMDITAERHRYTAPGEIIRRTDQHRDRIAGGAGCDRDTMKPCFKRNSCLPQPTALAWSQRHAVAVINPQRDRVRSPRRIFSQ